MRARNIKPSFFDNDLLGEVKPIVRLLFIGLWCLADREGRLEDRPRKIKKAILGYDNCRDNDIEKYLNELQEREFIIRYSVDDNPYIQVVNFLKHQRPHPNETPSEIPEYLSDTAVFPTGNSENLNNQSTYNLGDNNLQPRSCLNGLNPDIRNDDIRNDDTTDGCPGADAASVPFKKIKDLYNEICGGFPKILRIDGQRKKAVTARWAAYQDIEHFETLFRKAESSAFLKGTNDRNWSADFDWMMNATNFTKILEGKYDNHGGTQNGANQGNSGSADGYALTGFARE